MQGYCYCHLNQRQKEIYRILVWGIEHHQECLTFRTSKANVRKALEAVMLESAERWTCALEMSQMTDTADGCVLLHLFYLCPQSMQLKMELELDRRIQEIFSEIGLEEGQTDFEKAGKIHDYLITIPVLPFNEFLPSWPAHLFASESQESADASRQESCERQPKLKYVYQLHRRLADGPVVPSSQYGGAGACDWLPKLWKRKQKIAQQSAGASLPNLSCADSSPQKVRLICSEEPEASAMLEDIPSPDPCSALPAGSYSPDLNSIVSVLLFHRATPLGLARTFQYLCFYAHIECLLCAGLCQDQLFPGPVHHVWNVVRIDEDYYYADLFLDSQSTPSAQNARSFFLVSTNNMPHHFQHTPGPTCSTACIDPALQIWLPAPFMEEGRGELGLLDRFQFVA